MPERTSRIHIAAELSGVRVELIRAWERRYGFPRPQRTPSGYRVYTQRVGLSAVTDWGAGAFEEALAQLLEALPLAFGSDGAPASSTPEL